MGPIAQRLPLKCFFNPPAYVLVYGKTVFRDFRTSEQRGLGESLGEASSANTAFGLSRLLSMRNRNPLGVEGW